LFSRKHPYRNAGSVEEAYLENNHSFGEKIILRIVSGVPGSDE
jgi:hypothetical protein